MEVTLSHSNSAEQNLENHVIIGEVFEDLKASIKEIEAARDVAICYDRALKRDLKSSRDPQRLKAGAINELCLQLRDGLTIVRSDSMYIKKRCKSDPDFIFLHNLAAILDTPPLDRRITLFREESHGLGGLIDALTTLRRTLTGEKSISGATDLKEQFSSVFNEIQKISKEMSSLEAALK